MIQGYNYFKMVIKKITICEGEKQNPEEKLEVIRNKINEIIDFSIGGMIDNSVGYFYCKDKNKLPEMSDNRYIMIKHLGDGWYLYKTTWWKKKGVEQCIKIIAEIVVK